MKGGSGALSLKAGEAVVLNISNSINNKQSHTHTQHTHTHYIPSPSMCIMYIECVCVCVCVCVCMHFISTSLYYAVYNSSLCLCLCVIVCSSRPAVIINKAREYTECIIVYHYHIIVTLYCIVETQYAKHVSSTKTFGAVYNKLSNKQTELVVRLYNE